MYRVRLSEGFVEQFPGKVKPYIMEDIKEEKYLLIDKNDDAVKELGYKTEFTKEEVKKVINKLNELPLLKEEV